MAILTNSGRAAVAAAIKSAPIHLAWGVGDPAWDLFGSGIDPSADAAALVDELGRRRVTQTQYCLPDPDGEIVVPTGRFTASEDPTKYLYMRFAFNFEDASNATIREVAVFTGTVAAEGVPEGQVYLLPADIGDPGLLLAVEYLFPKLERSPAVRQQFEFVIEF